jgi:ATP adenylyltransferase
MDRLWSPWRSQHLEGLGQQSGAQDERSVFSRIAESADDEANLVLWRGPLAFALMNLFPYNNGHVLVVPYREVERYTDLTPEEQAALARASDRVMRWCDAALKPDGYNVGINVGEAGGAGIPRHLHLHVVPRWRGDTNFMPTLAQTKVVPEALRATYRKLLAVARASAEEPPPEL